MFRSKVEFQAGFGLVSLGLYFSVYILKQTVSSASQFMDAEFWRQWKVVLILLPC
jgi:hypothetical protein